MTSRRATKRKKEQEFSDPKGNCGDVAFALLMAYKDQGAVLCHGWPLGTGGNAKGMRYWHAWIELSGMLFDFANNNTLMTSPSIYYEAGTIDPAKVIRYSWAEADALFDEQGHTGPWADNPYLGTGVLTEEDVYGPH